MIETSTAIETTLEAHFEEWIAQRFPERSELKTLKVQAFSHFKALGLPLPKSEAYKYTPITRILEKNFSFNAGEPVSSWTKDECQAHFYAAPEANHLVFVNGYFTETYSTITSPSSELQIRLLNGATLTEHQEIGELLGKTGDSSTDPFAALNLSWFVQGLYIKAEKKSVNAPVFVYHFTDSAKEATLYPRILVVGESQSQVAIYEKTFTRGAGNVLSNSVFEAEVKENAQVSYTKIQHYTPSFYSIEGIYAHQHPSSRFYSNTYSFRTALTRNNMRISIDGDNCEAHMNGLYQLGGKSHVDNYTAVDHRKPNSFSNELYKGILDENARAVFNGKIYVRPDAQKTNAFQANNNILLTDTATINTKPQLEIWADDVKCSHGCTTGQLDKEAIFYLQSRGIEKSKAQAMILNAFANETLQEVGHDTVKQEIEALILNKLG